MRYLKKYNESFESFEDKIEINNICLELSDNGFYSDSNGRIIDNIEVRQAGGVFKDKTSVVSFHKGNRPFSFDEVSECVYRIKNIIGIENIGTFNYRLSFGDSYTRCDMGKLENETLESDIKDMLLKGGFITFNFPVNQ